MYILSQEQNDDRDSRVNDQWCQLLKGIKEIEDSENSAECVDKQFTLEREISVEWLR